MVRIFFILICTMNPLVGKSQYAAFIDPIDLGPTPIHSFVGEINGWGSTHGSPTYNPTELYMWFDNERNVGEGVFFRHNFLENTDYDISVGIVDADAYPIGNMQFAILLAGNVVVQGLHFSGQPIPLFSPSRLLLLYNGSNIHDKRVNIKFRTDVGQHFENIVIYPMNTTSTSVSGLTISCLSIFECPRNTNTYFYTSNYIPIGPTRGTNVYIGSALGSSTLLTKANPNAITDVIVKGQISVSENTELSISGNNYINLEVGQCFLPHLYPFDILPNEVVINYVDYACSFSKPSKEDEGTKEQVPETIDHIDRKSKANESVIIFPNPVVNNTFSLHNTLAQDLSFDLYNTNAQLLKSGNIQANSLVSIEIQNIPIGVYYIRLHNNSYEEVKKIVFK